MKTNTTAMTNAFIMKRIVPLVIFLFGATVVGHAQSLTQRIANNYFNSMQYEEAIPMYEGLLKKNKNNGEARINLAESYRRTNDTKNAVRLYAELAHLDNPAPQNVWQYAQVLAMDEQYQEAAEWYKKYSTMIPEDKWSKRFANAYANMDQFYKDSAQYRVKFAASLNSWQADFSPKFFRNGIVFISNRREEHGIKHVSEFDKSAFTDLYFAVDTSSVQTEIDNEQTYYSVDKHRDSYGDVSQLTSNDSDAPAKYGTHFLYDSIRYHYTKLTSIQEIGPMNRKFHEGPFDYFKGQDTVIVTRSAPYTKGPDGKSISQQALYMVKIVGRNDGEVTYLPFNNAKFSSGHPAFAPDYKTLYFISNRAGGKGGTDLYSVNYDNGVWSDPINIEELNTPGNEMFPYVDKLGTLYFSSDGRPGLGGLDIFKTYFKDGHWEAVKNLGYPFNSPKDDFGIMFSNSLMKGFFCSNRKRGFDDDDIYSFKQLCEGITVVAYDSITKAPLDSVRVTAGDQEKFTGPDGRATFCLVPGDIDFSASKYAYEKRATNSDRKEVPMPLHPIQFDLSGTIRSEEDKLPMDGVKVRLINNAGATLSEVTTGKDGVYKFPLAMNSKYRVIASKATCGTNTIAKSTEGLERSQHLHGDLTLICTGDIIRVENIYYDLNKYNIRPDAEPELNKLADLMWKYPDMRIELRSHTDSRASATFNMTLSAHRAQAAVDYLISKGIIPSRLRAAGYGESLPINKCKDGVKCTEEEYQANRRTEFKVLSIK